jgi:hypothetical protein
MIEEVQSKKNINLYELKQIENQALALTITDKWKLWHNRSGHLSDQNMKKITAQDTKFELKETSTRLCLR